MSTDNLEIFVVSDLHAISSIVNGSGPSYYTIANTLGTNSCPMASLKTFIQQEKICARVLLCCGDIGNKADPPSLRHSLDDLTVLRELLGAEKLIVTVGNHDIDSRLETNEHDPRGYLQSLSPLIPIDNEDLFHKFWSKHYVVLEESSYNLLVLNSSAFHGYAEELEHGRISKYMLDNIIEELSNLPTDKINLVMMHHHPCIIDDLNKKESYDVARGGSDLLERLSQGDLGEWLVIHGHRHYPRLTQASGGNSAPFILSSGSLGAITPHSWKVGNYCYKISFDCEKNKIEGIHAKVTSYEWTSNLGWSYPDFRNGELIPHKCGFGYLGRTKSLLDEIKKLPKQTYDWVELVSKIGDLEYLIPRELDALFKLIEKDVECGIDFDRSGYPVRIEVK